jgi:[histone H3]-lysine79 N-trimethyltransferase
MENPALARLKAAQAKKPTIITKSITASTSNKSRPPVRPATVPAKSSTAPSLSGISKAVRGHPPRPEKVSNGSRRPASKEPRDPVKYVRAQKHKSASPAVMTPRFTSSDEDEEESDKDKERARKRRRTIQTGIVDPNRRIRDLQAFSEEHQENYPMIHSADIANTTIIEHNRNKYEAFFGSVRGEDDMEPTIELQYPSASQREKYQLVKPTDQTDFKPLDEIKQNMKCVAEHYLDYDDAKKIFDEDDQSSGLVGQLIRAAKRGSARKVDAQHEFIEVVEKYNAMLEKLRKDGTLARNLDEMKSIPLPLVEHIVKNQVYARTVSPQVNLVRQYEGFSDNVYGELLPKFLSEIFEQTRLRSNHVFIDLGSGVGNCVLQAALEVGCESWGCEIMENPSKLAQLQAAEFPARCRLWGLKPGKIKLVQDNFLSNNEIDEVLKRADVVLINNQAFTPELNDRLKYKFLDLKEGCQIVSLKPFVDPNHKIKSTKIDDPVNILEVEEKDRYSNRVSWSNDPGHWYIHRKDSSRLQEFMKKMLS